MYVYKHLYYVVLIVCSRPETETETSNNSSSSFYSAVVYVNNHKSTVSYVNNHSRLVSIIIVFSHGRAVVYVNNHSRLVSCVISSIVHMSYTSHISSVWSYMFYSAYIIQFSRICLVSYVIRSLCSRPETESETS